MLYSNTKCTKCKFGILHFDSIQIINNTVYRIYKCSECNSQFKKSTSIVINRRRKRHYIKRIEDNQISIDLNNKESNR